MGGGGGSSSRGSSDEDEETVGFDYPDEVQEIIDIFSQGPSDYPAHVRENLQMDIPSPGYDSSERPRSGMTEPVSQPFGYAPRDPLVDLLSGGGGT